MKYDNIDLAWLDIRSAAIRLGVSVQAVHGLTDRGTLPFRWMGGRKFVKLEALVALVSDPEFSRRSRGSGARARAELLGQSRLDVEGLK